MSDFIPSNLQQIVYFIGVLFFIFGLKKVNSPQTTQKGLVLIAVGILLAVIITFYDSHMQDRFLWSGIAVLLGSSLAYFVTRKTKTTNTQQMIALSNALGAGAATLITAFILIQLKPMSEVAKYLIVAGGLIGSISFAGSLVASARLSGLIKKAIHLPMHQWLNAFLLVIAVTFGIAIVLNGNQFEITSLILFFIFALAFGIFMIIRMSEKDLPIVIALLVGLTGLVIAFSAYVLSNILMMVTGILIAAASTKLTLLMSRSLSRPFTSVLFSSNGMLGADNTTNIENSVASELQTHDAATMMAFSRNVIIVPGYGMAVAQAQHKVLELHKLLSSNNVQVKFAIHPAAGRMPGHMNTLLAEAEIPYDCIYDLEEINDEFARTDVVLVLGANDTINPSAHSNQNSPIFGMPVLQVDKAKNVIVIKRGTGTGYAGIDNPLLYLENTGIVYGDVHSVLSKLIMEIKKTR